MYKFSLFSVLFYAAVFGLSSASDFNCTPNESFKSDCNTCVCSSDGKVAACTQIACISDISEPLSSDSVTTEGSLEHIETNNHVCTPNDIKMQDCNRCRCAANGIGWFCTRRACPTKGHEKRAVQSPRSSCNAGERWNDGCNNCFCTETRIPVCTLIHCFGANENLRSTRSLPSGQEVCRPGSTWKQDCNSCFCSDTGVAACTLKGCLKNNVHHVSTSNLKVFTSEEFNDPNFHCTPLESFKLDCNTCKCANNGKTATWCTKKRCVGGE